MSILRIIFLDQDDKTSHSAEKLPFLNVGDISLFYYKPKPAGTPGVILYHKATEDNSYTGKRKSSAIWAKSEKFPEDASDDIHGLFDDAEVWVLSKNVERGHVVIGLQVLLETLNLEKEKSAFISDLINEFSGEGNYNGTTLNARGLLSMPGRKKTTKLGKKNLSETVTAMYETTVVEETSKRKEPSESGKGKNKGPRNKKTKVSDPLNWEAGTREEVMDLILAIDPLVKYEGFNSKLCRGAFMETGEDVEDIVKNMFLCFEAFAHIGNKITKLNVRRVDVIQAKKLMTFVENLGVKKSDRTATGLTLPRIAIAFMPEYLLFRKFVTKGLQNQTDSAIDVIYKDTTFYGCETIRKIAGYEDFHKQMSCIYTLCDVCGDITDKGFVKGYPRWCNVSKQGYKSDPDIHENMINALSSTSLTALEAFDQVAENVDDYFSNK